MKIQSAVWMRRSVCVFAFLVSIAAWQEGGAKVVAAVPGPTSDYATFIGGSDIDSITGTAVDATGNLYVTGFTDSVNFPATPGAFDTTYNGGRDAFVAKFDPTGSTLIYATYLGGNSYEQTARIAVDGPGNVYVIGQTGSANFPTTPAAYDPTFNGVNESDAFVFKLDSTGSTLLFSTFLGGTSQDVGTDIAVTPMGDVFVTGYTYSTNFPTTAAAYDTTHNGQGDVFVARLTPDGGALVYSTYLGGEVIDIPYGIAIDAELNVYVGGSTGSEAFPRTPGAYDTTLEGRDAYVTKIAATGSTLMYSTLIGGSGTDQAFSIALDASGAAYITGTTDSLDYPVTPGAYDATYNFNTDGIVAKLDPTGSALIYSTYFGGSASDTPQEIAVNAAGQAYVAGYTASANFPTTPGALDSTLGGPIDAFVLKFDSTGSGLVYSTYLGGTNVDVATSIALDARGSAYLGGSTGSTDFPTTPAAYNPTYNGGLRDGFAVKISDAGPPATVVLTPAAATNPVGTQHCVTATVEDAFGGASPDVVVDFTVAGSTMTSGSAATDDNGQATFCYQGPALPGADTITAYADANGNGAFDPAEPVGAAAKVWVLPATSTECVVTVSGGGHIVATNGDRATFGGNARVREDGEANAHLQYTDHGPAQPTKMHTLDVLAIVCDGPSSATIYGTARVDGHGTVQYRIRVQDNGEPGAGRDVYGILLDTGYYSGEQPLVSGNIQVRRD